MEHLGHKLVSIWDAGITASCFACSTTMLAPASFLLNENPEVTRAAVTYPGFTASAGQKSGRRYRLSFHGVPGIMLSMFRGSFHIIFFYTIRHYLLCNQRLREVMMSIQDPASGVAIFSHLSLLLISRGFHVYSA